MSTDLLQLIRFWLCNERILFNYITRRLECKLLAQLQMAVDFHHLAWPHLNTGLLPRVIIPVFIEFTGPDTIPLMRVNNFHFLGAST